METRIPHWLRRWVPIFDWASGYRTADFSGDAIAGLMVSIMLVPQAMAYAMLAGLPPQTGLYASLLPLVLVGIFGSSRTLAVGPVAIVSLLTAAAIQRVAPEGGAAAIQTALTLAGLVGVMMVIMGIARLGVITHFLNHPVIPGFTSAAATIIAWSQLKHLLGVDVPASEHTHQIIMDLIQRAGNIQGATLAMGGGALILLVITGKWLGPWLQKVGVKKSLAKPLAQTGPLVVVALTTVMVWMWGLDRTAGIRTVGAVQAGLPPLSWPTMGWAGIEPLLGAALTIALVGFIGSFSVAKTLASKRRQNVLPDREMVALGLANMGAAVTSGCPITGGFSRSVVNFAAGAKTPLASLITAALVLITVVVLTPLFYYIPRTVLAAIIMTAVMGLINLKEAPRLWHYSRADYSSFVLTFVIVLLAGVELGVGIGAGTALALYLWRSTRPHIAVLGRIGDTGHFRNVHRHKVRVCPGVLAIRVDESLYSANARFLEDHLLRLVAEQQDLENLVLDCSAINHIDSSALETLEKLVQQLRDSGVGFHLAAVKGPVMDRLERAGFPEHFGRNCIHLSLDGAMTAVGCATGDLKEIPDPPSSEFP